MLLFIREDIRKTNATKEGTVRKLYVGIICLTIALLFGCRAQDEALFENALEQVEMSSYVVDKEDEELLSAESWVSFDEVDDSLLFISIEDEVPQLVMNGKRVSDGENAYSIEGMQESFSLDAYDEMTLTRIADTILLHGQALKRDQYAGGEAEIKYCVTYADENIFSMIIKADSSKNEHIYPLTFDVKTGILYSINDFFVDDVSGWRGTLADVVSEAANEYGLSLLSDVPPVGDDRLFFIDENANPVLLYRPYEIATNHEGYPCFVLEGGDVEMYFNDDLL